MRAPAPRHLSLLLAGILALSSAVPAFAAPTNAKIEAAKKKAAEARSRLEDLGADLEERQEEYAEIEAQLLETTNLIGKTESDLALAERDLVIAERAMRRRAVSMYRTGPAEALVLLLDIRDFNDLLTRLELMSRISEKDVALVDAVTDARDKAEERRRSLEARRAEEVALRNQARTKQAQVQEAFDAQKGYLANLEADVARLIEEEKERQRKLAEERARRAAAARAAAARAAAAAAAARGPVTPASLRSGRDFDPNALGAGHPEVIGIAEQYLGVPYVWGGTSPSGFDCSGLCQYVYAQIGIGLPRNSRAQYRVGAYIPPDRRDLLLPGDLVFFGRGGDPNRVHHVGIYAGGDSFIHAPYTGDVVRYASLQERIDTKQDYVGAVRP